MVILSFHTNNPINFVGYFTCAVHNLLNLNHLKRQINRSLYYIYIMHIYIQLYIYIYTYLSRVAQSELRLTTGWMVRDRIPVGKRFSTSQDRFWGPTQPPVKWVQGLSRGKVRPRRVADHSPLLVPRPWKSRAIPLLTLWATPGL